MQLLLLLLHAWMAMNSFSYGTWNMQSRRNFRKLYLIHKYMYMVKYLLFDCICYQVLWQFYLTVSTHIFGTALHTTGIYFVKITSAKNCVIYLYTNHALVHDHDVTLLWLLLKVNMIIVLYISTQTFGTWMTFVVTTSCCDKHCVTCMCIRVIFQVIGWLLHFKILFSKYFFVLVLELFLLHRLNLYV